MLLENEIVKDRIEDKVKHQITTTAHGVTISLEGHKSFEKEVECINKGN